MLLAEARWFARQFANMGDAALYPMLNVGSHTEAFRVREQPWIDRHLFARARRRRLPVVHTDLRSAPGVDLVGDLTDPVFVADLASRRFRSVMCNNLLEHLQVREPIVHGVLAAVEPGGYLFVSCPFSFPYHPDPIDTMYRPTPRELADLFPGTRLVTSQVVECGNLLTYLAARVAADPSMTFRMLYRRREQAVHQTQDGLSLWQWLPWTWKTFTQTCIVLQKQ